MKPSLLKQVNEILWDFVGTAALLLLSTLMVGFIVGLCYSAIKAAYR